MIIIFCEIAGRKIPLVTTGTSPFIGAGQFGVNAFKWREKFLNNPNAMVEILEASYQAGARGIEAIPTGKIIEATKIMMDRYEDYVVTGSTYPGRDPGIDTLLEVGAKLIFVHGLISDNKGNKLEKLLETINARGAIPGIATHDPIPTIKFAIHNSLNVKVFLIPFNTEGFFMSNASKLENLVDTTNNYSFIGMKTLGAGRINPKVAFQYISNHNICAVTIGMVEKNEAMESTRIALEALSNKIV